MYPVSAPGVRDLWTVLAPGRYRVEGVVEAERLDRWQWAKRTGQRVPPKRGDRVEYYRKRHLVVRVSKWCYQPPKRPEPFEKELIEESGLKRSDYCR